MEDTIATQDRHTPPRKTSTALFNVLTLLVLLSLTCTATVFWTIYKNPYSVLNPFPPPTLPVAVAMPTNTPTPIGALPATWTPAPTGTPLPTDTPRPTATLPPTFTPFTILTLTPPSPTVSPTATKRVSLPFVVEDRPIAVPNIAHPDLGCNWLGVAGKVSDMSGGPKTQVIVVLGGSLEGKSVGPGGTLYSLTGVAPSYGQAGYEFVLGTKPVASQDTLWIQLLDQNELPLSEKVYFDTYDSCEKNLIVISFKQVRK